MIYVITETTGEYSDIWKEVLAVVEGPEGLDMDAIKKAYRDDIKRLVAGAKDQGITRHHLAAFRKALPDFQTWLTANHADCSLKPFTECEL
jgi:hypothetical protein